MQIEPEQHREARGATDDLERAAEHLEDSLASLVGDYEERESGDRPRARGIYLLPNLFTTAALFCGFYAIVACLKGEFYSGAVAVFVAMIFDALDGRVARLTNTSSAFGAEYDSLSDMISFGLAPSLLVFNYALVDTGKVGWVAAFLYTACAALRLARFNTQQDKGDGSQFTGLASPAAAALAAGAVWLGIEYDLAASVVPLAPLWALLLALLGFLMVARFPYQSFKTIRLEQRVPLARMLLIVVLLGLVALNPPLVLWSLFLIYAMSGPVQHLRRSVVKASMTASSDEES
jgi:CDP-diacylglycerol--serine O-phosphatidyltransferase